MWRLASSSGPATDDGENEALAATRTPRSPAIVARGWGLAGLGRWDKEDLRRRVVIPERLRTAMTEAMRFRDPESAAEAAASAIHGGRGEEDAPESPLVVFINSRSGGRHGPVLKARLQDLIGGEQVLDLSITKPSDFVQYALICLEKLADMGDDCARAIREKFRVLVGGGDGTVGWVLGCLGELHVQNRGPVPPVGIIPLGTGNDLSRNFGWGGSFPFAWRTAIKRSLYKTINGPICRLDSWQVTALTPEGETIELPHCMKHHEDYNFDLNADNEGEFPVKYSCFSGVFYNYFSIGMDAQVAYGFHHLRDEKPYFAQGPTANKLIYSGYGCRQGWFFTPCMSDPGLRDNCAEWEQVPVPSSVRAIVALNLHSYGSGRNPWGNLKPEYLERKGFVEAHVDDGLLEIFGLKQGWHASLVMVELISAKHIAQVLSIKLVDSFLLIASVNSCNEHLTYASDIVQAAAIRLEIRGGEWSDAYMQMDGEPWKQPMKTDYSCFVEIKRVPFQSFVVNGE